MRTHDGSSALEERDRGCVLTVGNFDGVHLGHQTLLGAVLARARELDREAAVYTFHPRPQRVLAPHTAGPELMQWEQLVARLEECGVSHLIRETFTPEFASLAPEAFLAEILAERIAPVEIFVGRDFHFGKGRSGSGETLAEIAPGFGMRVEIIGQVKAADRDVSSTRIREALLVGDVAQATLCLGRPYAIWGRVVEGDRRGRTLGFPTANLETQNDLIPARGVYATRVRRIEDGRPGGPELLAVTNVGTRPTFDAGQVLAETHLIDFDGELYGAELELQFCERLRAEQRFPSPDALREQIGRDVEAARACHAAAGA